MTLSITVFVIAPKVLTDHIPKVAGAVDAGSDHPLALAMVERAKGLALPQVARHS